MPICAPAAIFLFSLLLRKQNGGAKRLSNHEFSLKKEHLKAFHLKASYSYIEIRLFGLLNFDLCQRMAEI